jgi:hypothetical protein
MMQCSPQQHVPGSFSRALLAVELQVSFEAYRFRYRNAGSAVEESKNRPILHVAANQYAHLSPHLSAEPQATRLLKEGRKGSSPKASPVL